jgi:hypothetical protein
MGRRSWFLRILAPCLLALAFGTHCQKKPASPRVASLAIGAPAVVTMPSGRTDVFVLGSDGNVWQSTCTKGCNDRSRFTDWSRQPGRPPGGATSDPTGVSWGEGRIDLFIRGSISNIWHQTWEDGVWLGWEDLDGRTDSGPTASSRGSGNLHVFVLAGNAVWHRACVATDSVPLCRGSSWMSWIADPGGPPTRAAAVTSVSNAAGNVDVALKGSDNALWFQRWAGSNWIGWRSLGGQLTSSPVLVASAGRTGVYAVDVNGKLVHGFIDSPDAPLTFAPANAELGGDPAGAFLSDSGRALLVSRPRGAHAFEAVHCAPGADCTRMQ